MLKKTVVTTVPLDHVASRIQFGQKINYCLCKGEEPNYSLKINILILIHYYPIKLSTPQLTTV